MESVDIKNIVVIGIVTGSGRRKGKFLFVKETNGAIRFPGGKVKAGETLKEALRREIKEETMLDCPVGGLACIEHASIWERGAPRAAKSILLYFFDISITQQSQSHKEGLIWMDRNQIEESKAVIPYDNLLIARGLASVELGRPYVVPPGFQDTPGDPNRVATRTFCWFHLEARPTRPAINA